jgi:hypothetical protein
LLHIAGRPARLYKSTQLRNRLNMSMKTPVILILLAVSAVPAAAVAETTSTVAPMPAATSADQTTVPLLKTKWTLKQPSKPSKKARLQQANNVEGPKLPPPQRQKRPRPPRAPVIRAPSSINKKQATQAIAGITRGRN